MIDLETCATGPDACILTVAAQWFDPLQRTDTHSDRWYYARVDTESQPDRAISQDTLAWWAQQSPAAQEEAFNPNDRVPFNQMLQELHSMVWNTRWIYANGPTFDMTILEHAFKSQNMALPWQYHSVRDVRTIYSLVPELNKYPASHHALEDCRRQIELLWDSLEYLKVRELK